LGKQVALVTGASSGFGLLTTIELAKAGILVVATIRDIDKKGILLKEAKKQNIEDNIDILQLDVTKAEELQSVKNYVLSTYKSIDFLINNAGFALGGIAEDLSIDDYKNQFDTNLFGAIAVTKAFIPSMRKNRKGKIINIGSISGSFGFPGLTPYASSKFALRGFSEALRLELLPLNIYVCLIEPGSYKTNIWEKGLKEIDLNVHEDYKKMMEMAYQGSTYARDNSEDPLGVAKLIKKIIFEKKPAFYYPIGKGIKTMLLMKKLIPWSFIEHNLKKKMS
jgi:NAD(P)-dependent dehydrogenase (short-subunit alcohol dehydrogenase family)